MDLPLHPEELKFPSIKVKATARAMQNFAAVLNTHNDCYYDDSREGGIRPHPCFPIVTTWPLFEQFMPVLQKAGLSGKAMTSLVHYSERIIHHAPMKPNKRLRIQCHVKGMFDHPKGTEMQFHIAAYRSKSKRIFEEFPSILFRGIKSPHLTPRNHQKETSQKIPNLKDSGEIALHIPKLLPYLYDGCTDIIFPIHTSPRFAKNVGLPNIIVQGSATFSLGITKLMQVLNIQDPRRVKRVEGQFGSFVLPGEDLTIRWKTYQLSSLEILCEFQLWNEAQKKPIRSGKLVFS